jgi:molybdenum cofactor cytidylyltransferase
MSARSTGIILLAAGDSSRLGQPKQLLHYKESTLLQIAIDAADEASAKHKLLVLGANSELIKKSIDLKSISLTENPDWKDGMSSSLNVALRQLLKLDPEMDQIITVLSDQPFITSSLINALIATQTSSGKGIVACRYEDTLGVPVLFDKKYFDEILDLDGSMGAKKLIFQYPDDRDTVYFPEGKIDIDTLEDYKKLAGEN